MHLSRGALKSVRRHSELITVDEAEEAPRYFASATENADERFQEDDFLVLDLIENARLPYHVYDMFGRRVFLKIGCSNFYLKDGQIMAEYRQLFGSAALKKVAEVAEKQEAPSGRGFRFKKSWSGWRDSNPRPLAPEASALPG